MYELLPTKTLIMTSYYSTGCGGSLFMFSYADGSTLFKETSRPILTRCQENVYCYGICEICKITFVVSYKFCFIYIVSTGFYW